MQTPFLFVALLLAFHSSNAQYAYNCLIAGCQNAQNCNSATPTQCEDPAAAGAGCAATFFNYNCGATTDATPGACDSTCTASNYWECSNGCVCLEGFYNSPTDSTCANARVRAVCKNNGMDLFFAPHEGALFADSLGGNVYQVTNDGTTDTIVTGCAFAADAGTPVETQEPGGGTVYSIRDFPYTGTPTAGCTLPVEDAAATPGPTYTSIWYIQYGGTRSHSNVRVTITCTAQDVGATETASISFGGSTPTNAAEVAVDELVVSGVTWRLADILTPDTALTGTIPADNEISLVIDMITGPNAVYGDYSLARLSAYNYNPALTVPADADPLFSLSQDLITDACALRWAGGVISAMSKAAATDGASNPVLRITVNFKPFVFRVQAAGFTVDSTPSIALGTVWLQIELCLGTCTRPIGTSTVTDCDPTLHITDSTNFPDMLASVRRRKRQVHGALQLDGTTVTSNMSIVVLGLDNAVTRHTVDTPSADDTSCHQTLTFLLPIVILAVMLLVAMVMAAFFCMKVSRGQGHPEGHTNMAYK